MAARNLDVIVLWGWPTMWDFYTANARYLSPIGGNAEFNVLVFPAVVVATMCQSLSILVWHHSFRVCPKYQLPAFPRTLTRGLLLPLLFQNFLHTGKN